MPSWSSTDELDVMLSTFKSFYEEKSPKTEERINYHFKERGADGNVSCPNYATDATTQNVFHPNSLNGISKYHQNGWLINIVKDLKIKNVFDHHSLKGSSEYHHNRWWINIANDLKKQIAKTTRVVLEDIPQFERYREEIMGAPDDFTRQSLIDEVERLLEMFNKEYANGYWDRPRENGIQKNSFDSDDDPFKGNRTDTTSSMNNRNTQANHDYATGKLNQSDLSNRGITKKRRPNEMNSFNKVASQTKILAIIEIIRRVLYPIVCWFKRLVATFFSSINPQEQKKRARKALQLNEEAHVVGVYGAAKSGKSKLISVLKRPNQVCYRGSKEVIFFKMRAENLLSNTETLKLRKSQIPAFDDLIIVTGGMVKKSELECAFDADKLGVRCIFVRSKCDHDMYNAVEDGNCSIEQKKQNLLQNGHNIFKQEFKKFPFRTPPACFFVSADTMDQENRGIAPTYTFEENELKHFLFNA